MSEPDEIHEFDYECPGCGRQFPGPWSMDNHVSRCQKALLLEDDDIDPQDNDDHFFGDDMMGASG